MHAREFVDFVRKLVGVVLFILMEDDPCSPFFFSDAQNRKLLLLYSSISLLTVIVCCIGTVLVILLKLYQKIVYRLALYQTLGACFFGITRSIQLGPKWGAEELQMGDSDFCKAVAYAIVCSSWVKLTLTVSITVHLFMYTVFLKNLKKLEPLYVILPMILGPLFAAIPFTTDSYGDTGPWCWIRTGRNACLPDMNNVSQFNAGEIQQITVWYGPAFVTLLFTSVLVIVTVAVFILRIHSLKAKADCRHKGNGEQQVLIDQDGQNNSLKQALYLLLPLLAYPVIFCTLIIVPLVNRVYNVFVTKPSYTLYMASAIAIPSMGLAAGITLITHIACMKLSSKKKSNKWLIDEEHRRRDKHTITMSTACRTHFEVVRESEIEKQGLNLSREHE